MGRSLMRHLFEAQKKQHGKRRDRSGSRDRRKEGKGGEREPNWRCVHPIPTAVPNVARSPLNYFTTVCISRYTVKQC